MKINLFGVKISFNFFFLFLVSFGIITSLQGQSVIILSLLSAIVHEIGHIVFIAAFEEKPRSIEINLYEVKINCNISRCGLKEEILITLAGVIFNFTISLILWILSLWIDALWMLEFSLCNLCVGLINLAPFESFDGGQLLLLILTRLLSVKAANVILTILTVGLIFPFAFFGIYLLFSSQYNFSLLFIAIYLLISISKKLS